jgi:hypothetical protein
MREDSLRGRRVIKTPAPILPVRPNRALLSSLRSHRKKYRSSMDSRLRNPWVFICPEYCDIALLLDERARRYGDVLDYNVRLAV